MSKYSLNIFCENKRELHYLVSYFMKSCAIFCCVWYLKFICQRTIVHSNIQHPQNSNKYDLWFACYHLRVQTHIIICSVNECYICLWLVAYILNDATNLSVTDHISDRRLLLKTVVLSWHPKWTVMFWYGIFSGVFSFRNIVRIERSI